MFGAAESQKNTFLEQTKAERNKRAAEKKRETAIIFIQARIRGWTVRKQILERIM